MKPHLAIVCGIYYPEPSPTGQCVARFVELLKDEFDIDIISISSTGEEQGISLPDGTRVYTLCSKRMLAEASATGVHKKLLHLLGAAQIKLHWLGNLAWFRKAATAMLTKLHIDRPYSCVLTVCSPMAAHAAGVDFKAEHPAVRHVAYTVDPYAAEDRILPVFTSLQQLAVREKAMLAKADALLLSEEIYCNRPDLYTEAAVLPYILPTLQEPTEKPAGEYIDCVYAGRFYANIRNPEELLRTFSLIKDPRIRLQLFSVGCEDMVRLYADRNPNIVAHGLVSHDDILRIYRYADVLVNVGNTSAEFLPSKTFEYIVTGKPILHFCGNGATCAPLESYPLALQVDADTDIGTVERFLSLAEGKHVPAESILTIYREHTGEKVKEILLNALNGR